MLATLHGHFYQPPRENPWTGEISRQGGARPYHDWNARITDECYRANGWSRILNEQQRIVSIVNNYESLSFDFGPTLLRDLERRQPRVYRRVLEADAASVKAHGGHGNAIAQAYNHTILPLTSLRDKVTQVRWGLRDFESRFGRPSESLWLPETAICNETLAVLVAHGIRYVILAPSQGRRYRKLGSNDWTEVDPRRGMPTGRPFRCFAQPDDLARVQAAMGKTAKSAGPGERNYVDIFFYDGELAAAVSFQHLLRRSEDLADRLEAARDRAEGGLVHLATDGEVYGHHERYGDMCLAYFAEHEAKRRGIRLVNYGEALDLLPPECEVELALGPQGEGTAWSCAHGVSRWIRDCGCQTYAEPSWNQAWRGPLRAGLDALRHRIQETFAARTAEWVRDPWAARDDYIEVVLDPSRLQHDEFLARHAKHGLSNEDRRGLWCLLEATHQAMLMYTSCAWFFADVSGLEVRQNLAYAARAAELAQEFTESELEPILLAHLAHARSNVETWHDGAEVYRRVTRRRVGPAQVAAQAAFERAFLMRPLSRRLHRFRVEGTLRRAGGEKNAVHATSSWTGEITVNDDLIEDRSSYQVKIASSRESGRVIQLIGPEGKIETSFRSVLRSLPGDARRETARELQDLLLQETKSWVRHFRELPERVLPELEAEASPFFRVIEQTVLRWELRDLARDIESGIESQTPPWKKLRPLLRRARRARLKPWIRKLGDALAHRVEVLVLDGQFEAASDLLEEGASVGISIPLTRIEEMVFERRPRTGEVPSPAWARLSGHANLEWNRETESVIATESIA